VISVECNCTEMAAIDMDDHKHGHHVNCATNTERMEMAKLCFDDQWCVMEVGDALDTLRDLEAGEKYEFQKVWMTRNEINALPEFQGW